MEPGTAWAPRLEGYPLINEVFRDVDAPDGLDRAQFLRRAGVGGVALMSGGTILASVTSTASAQAPTDLDGQIATAAASAELLAVYVYDQAIKSKLFTGGALAYLKEAKKQEQAHYDALAGILTGAGATPPKKGDFTYKLPKFAGKTKAAQATSIVKFGKALETAFVGAYVLAAGVLSTAELRSAAAAIGANEGSHLGFFTGAAGGIAIAPAVPKAAKSLDAVIATVGTYQKKKA